MSVGLNKTKFLLTNPTIFKGCKYRKNEKIDDIYLIDSAGNIYYLKRVFPQWTHLFQLKKLLTKL